jgi:hypothetical protein
MQFSGEGLVELRLRMSDGSIGMQAMRVLLACCEHTDKQNRVEAGRKDLSRILEMPESNVARALKALVDCGFLEPPDLRHRPYVVSPRFFWRANTGDLKRALAARGMLGKDGMMKSREAA